jgi:hypothetical protein
MEMTMTFLTIAAALAALAFALPLLAMSRS